MKPRPAEAATISAATRVVQPKPMPMRMPVRISGIAAAQDHVDACTWPAGGAQGVGGVDLLDRHRADAGPGGESARGAKIAEVDDHHLL